MLLLNFLIIKILKKKLSSTTDFNIDFIKNIKMIMFLDIYTHTCIYICVCVCVRSHITLQPKNSRPLKLSRVEPGKYLDGRPPGKTWLLLEEVLVRPAGGAHPVVCVGPNTPV